jgi:hypothetical protein
MLLAKDIKTAKELQEYFAKPKKVVVCFIDLARFFEIKSVCRPLNCIEKRSISSGECFTRVYFSSIRSCAKLMDLFYGCRQRTSGLASLK